MATQTVVSSAAARTTARRGRFLVKIAWLAPPLLYFLLLFTFPLFNLIRISLAEPLPGQVLPTGWTLTSYREMFVNPFYLSILWSTVRIGLLVTLFTLLIGYPLAFFLARTRSRWKGILLSLTIAPILISAVVRSYGWLVLLSDRGIVNSLLMNLKLIPAPIKLIFNETGVIIGTTHVLLPFMVLAIMGSLQSLDPRLEEAASSLGAPRWRVFWDVIWPLSLPGVIAGAIIVFVLAVGSFVTTMLLGGQTVLTLPLLAYQQFGIAFNWPFGSALGVLLLVVVMALSFGYDLILQPRLLRGRRKA